MDMWNLAGVVATSRPTSGLSPRHYRPFWDYDPRINNQLGISWDFGLKDAEDGRSRIIVSKSRTKRECTTAFRIVRQSTEHWSLVQDYNCPLFFFKQIFQGPVDASASSRDEARRLRFNSIRGVACGSRARCRYNITER
jgi:hypothetical protein